MRVRPHSPVALYPVDSVFVRADDTREPSALRLDDGDLDVGDEKGEYAPTHDDHPAFRLRGRRTERAVW